MGNIGGSWTVGLDDLRCLFQPWWFFYSTVKKKGLVTGGWINCETDFLSVLPIGSEIIQLPGCTWQLHLLPTSLCVHRVILWKLLPLFVVCYLEVKRCMQMCFHFPQVTQRGWRNRKHKYCSHFCSHFYFWGAPAPQNYLEPFGTLEAAPTRAVCQCCLSSQLSSPSILPLLSPTGRNLSVQNCRSTRGKTMPWSSSTGIN